MRFRFWSPQAQFLRNDPGYLSCSKKECKKFKDDGTCLVRTCSGSLSFHVINFRTDVEFVLFAGGFLSPCILKRTDAISFANPKQPLYGHLNSIDSTGTSVSEFILYFNLMVQTTRRALHHDIENYRVQSTKKYSMFLMLFQKLVQWTNCYSLNAADEGDVGERR